MNDYIDRQAAIDAINRAVTKEVARWSVKELPSAEVEPVKHGRWEPVTNGRGGHECSICHSYAPSYKNGEEHLSPYCPNCGAKMEERREDGDGDG